MRFHLAFLSTCIGFWLSGYVIGRLSGDSLWLSIIAGALQGVGVVECLSLYNRGAKR